MASVLLLRQGIDAIETVDLQAHNMCVYSQYGIRRTDSTAKHTSLCEKRRRIEERDERRIEDRGE